MTILVSLHGVLKSHAGQPIREGRYLCEALVQAAQRVLLMSDESMELSEHWLMQNGVKGYAGILTPSLHLGDDESIRERQISVARAMGPISLVVDADPKVVAHCLGIGVTSLLFAHPTTSLPKFRPDQDDRESIHTWAQIQEQLDAKHLKEWSE